MNHIVATLLNLHGPAVYAAVTAMVFLEAAAFVGLVIPGETALMVGGVLASRGNISIAVLAVLAAVAAVTGDSVGYWAGHRFGPAIERSGLGRRVGESRWQQAYKYVQRKGTWAVVLGRWVGVMRALVPATAGMVGMPYRRFLVANVAGGLGWVAVVLSLAYTAGGSIATVQKALGRASTVSVVVVAVIAVAAAVTWRRARNRSDASASSSTKIERTSRSSLGSRVVDSWAGPALGVTVAATFAVLELADGARERGDLAAHDPAVTRAVVEERTPLLTGFADAATLLGGTVSIGALTVGVLAWLLWRRRAPRTALLVASTMATSVVLTVVLKHVIGRARPPATTLLGPVDGSFAFPSGHTLNSTVFFGLVAGLALAQTRSVKGRALVVATWAAASLCVGLSRVYLGYHWLTDVMAGWSVGIGVLGLVTVVVTLVPWFAHETRSQASGGHP